MLNLIFIVLALVCFASAAFDRAHANRLISVGLAALAASLLASHVW